MLFNNFSTFCKFEDANFNCSHSSTSITIFITKSDIFKNKFERSKCRKLDGGNLVWSLIYSILQKGLKENPDQANGDYYLLRKVNLRTSINFSPYQVMWKLVCSKQKIFIFIWLLVDNQTGLLESHKDVQCFTWISEDNQLWKQDAFPWKFWCTLWS